ncbi:MAG: hypothetical protein A2571_03685 [Candidatus Vogelbacteria bacterium RIFOXYD1_FULL_44_32]|uniref:SIMPL domain-containing protein n=1 Tax=Candidatus Vogelbacteria bacterium RIFOXYD1_FULL_44_32 TaxID=1802438 RepID=A0A1G2QCH6_9BACT|nr:MAG: hypothetical protein A2571_03685 [Candidatus Vogelbacteria bacterium RIFOXYD1_FULL_44_32]
MDTQIKNILGIVVIVVLVVGAGSAMVFTRAFSKSVNPASTRSFTVTGEGEIMATPDIADFSFSVISQRGADLTALQADNTTKVNKAIEYLKAQGIEAKDIKTSGYNISPQYEYYQCKASGVCPPARITGYEVSQTVAVKVRDFTKVGPLLSGVVKNGANSVSSLEFRLEDPTGAQNDARTEAIAKAKAQAKEVAKAGGFRLGKLLSIEEVNGYMPFAYGRGGGVMMAEQDSKQAITPTVEPGSNSVKMQVILHYEIK